MIIDIGQQKFQKLEARVPGQLLTRVTEQGTITMQESSTSSIDPQSLRYVLGRFASGITVITGMVDNVPSGFTCQSFYSVSLTPPLVSFCVMKTSKSWPAIRESRRFVVNVLSEEQRAVSDVFAKSGGEKWKHVDWAPSQSCGAILANTLMWLDCSLHSEHELGDHLLVVGKVNEASPIDSDEHRRPLIYFRGQYHQLQAHT
ncbi:Flavin-dependent monooxygenase, reductase subunit HsaB [Bradyrhizobium ivorense]|uniref:Flavin-dependent monooxygenase, reductase subunit HsaB n=1 Tax=Bradyrhizobium ivorense TaxID=2511166 RepID=A0A508T3X0_9BRAD|nr:flavin reductase family protein [Bradyrhizobium ivorense]VIO70082.1 Flavin-dependent monooxygenase, reductase subunit HsaB [Bradyrhizobium ivorense]